MNGFIIDFESPGSYYILLYFLAFQAGLVYLVIAGKRLGYAHLPWVLTIFSSFLLFVIGCKIFLFGSAEWSALLRGDGWPHVSGRTVIGGLVFGLAGIVAGVRWLGLPPRALDAFAFLVPITLLIQRAGCFLAGCCYGSTTPLPWAVTYGQHHHAFKNHSHAGLIVPDSAASLPVHPVQLYEVLGCMLIIVCLWYMQKKNLFRSPGSLLLSSGILYGVVRFADEFVRATHAPLVAGLNKVQIMVFMISVVTVLILFLNERKAFFREPTHHASPFFKCLILFIALGFLYSISWGIVDTLEVISLYAVVMLCIVSLVYAAFTRFTTPTTRWSSVSVLSLGMVLMSQVAPEKETKNEEQRHYYTVALGFLSGNHTLSDERVSEDCDGSQSYSLAKFREKYAVGNLGFSKSIVESRGNTLTFGINGQLGRLTEKGEGNVASSRSLTLYAFNPFVRYDMRYFGGGGGFHYGDMPMIRGDFNSEQATLIRRYRFYPQFYVRGGELRTFFGEVMVGDGIGGTFPGSAFQMTAGYGFHKTNGAAIRIGMSSRVGVFLSSTIPAGEHLLIEPYVGFGTSAFTEYSSESNFQGALRLAYRFGDLSKN